MLRLFPASVPTSAPCVKNAVVMRVPQPAMVSAAESFSLKTRSALDSPLCPKGLILMCGEMGSMSRDLQDWGERMRAVVMVVSRRQLDLGWLRNHASRLDFLLVDSDSLEDTELTIDFCMRVRRAVPALPLVLVSSEVRSHDFTCERMMACDVTLKPPLLHSALTLGVQAAYQNNSYYLKETG